MPVKIGNPEQFDLEQEHAHTDWGKKFRETRLVFRKKDGDFEFHSYSGDTRAQMFIKQVQRAHVNNPLNDFDYVRLYTTDNNPMYDIVEASDQPVFSQTQINENIYCCPPFARKQYHPKLIICPDFQFAQWLHFDYEIYVDEVRRASLSTPTIDKACWRGLARPKHSNRSLLCKISEQNPDCIDAKHTGMNINQDNYLSMIEMVKNYKYLIDTQAHGFSGRLKYLMNSHRLIFMQDRHYQGFIEEQLIPWKHFIPIRYDFADLVEKIQWARDFPIKSQQINDNMFDLASEQLPIPAINNKWKSLLDGQSQV